MATPKEHLANNSLQDLNAITAMARLQATLEKVQALLGDSMSNASFTAAPDTADTKTAAEMVPKATGSSSVQDTAKILKDVYEQCYARVLYKKELIERSIQATESELDTYWIRKHRLKFQDNLPNKKHIMQKRICDELHAEIDRYQSICDKIQSGISTEGIDNLFLLLKEIGNQEFADKSSCREIKQKSIKHFPEQLFTNKIIANLSSILSEDLKEILPYFIYNEEGEMGLNIIAIETIVVSACNKLNKVRNYLLEFAKHGHSILILKVISSILDSLNMKFFLSLTVEGQKIVKDFTRIFNKVNFSERLIKTKKMIKDLKIKAAPIHAQRLKLSSLQKNIKKIEKLINNITLSRDRFDNQTLEYYKNCRLFFDKIEQEDTCLNEAYLKTVPLRKFISEKMPHWKGIVGEIFEASNKCLDGLGEQLDITKKLELVVEELEINDFILNQYVDSFQEVFLTHENAIKQITAAEQQRKEVALTAAATPETTKETTNGNANSSPSTDDKVASKPKPAKQVNPQNSDTVPPQIKTNWKEKVEERKIILAAERAKRKRDKVVADLQELAKKKELANMKFQMDVLDLNAREETIRQALRINPNITKLFLKLYSTQPEFAHEDLMALINALQVQRFKVTLDYRDSHYTVMIEGKYGHFDENDFVEKSKAVKAHNKDVLFFSKRTISSLQNLFTRSGFTRALFIQSHARPETAAAAISTSQYNQTIHHAPTAVDNITPATLNLPPAKK